MITTISSYAELLTAAKHFAEPVVIGFFGAFSSRSESARPHFAAFCTKHPDLLTVQIDVAQVKDIHPKFGVTEVPTVIVVHEGKVIQQALGVGSVEDYEAALLAAVNERTTQRSGAARPVQRVTVYSTPVCPWCTKVKNYLRSRGINYTDVDVSRDERTAQELVRRSGQTGVPQIDINGRLVVGFDKTKIDALLGLSGSSSGAEA